MIQNNPKGFTQWIVLVIVTLLLGSLLFIKFTGRQDIFNYQGIRSTTPGFDLYSGGVHSINSWLKLGTGSTSLKQGMQFLQDAYVKTQDKKLLELLSGQLDKARSLELIQKTTHCLDVLQNGFGTITSIMHEYALLTSGFQSITTSFQDITSSLPDSPTKQCLTTYMDNLKESVQGLVLTYKNIDSLSQQYGSSVSEYTKSLGSCLSLEQTVDALRYLEAKLKLVNASIVSVQKHLDSNNVAQYNELCSYGTIQGLTGLQLESWRILQGLEQGTELTLQKVDNIGEYVEQLKKQTTTLSGKTTQGRWQELWQK